MKPLLLVIEDDENISLSLRVFFEGKGYGVITTEFGREGLSVALKEVPDIVLLDLRLPDLYGIEVLRAIKADYSEISVIEEDRDHLPNKTTARNESREKGYDQNAPGPVFLEEISLIFTAHEKSISRDKKKTL